jgi:transcriptional regulator with XRE-family HTH domain
MLSDIGMRIKKRREELGMTQEDLAAALGYKSKSSINKIELGVQNLKQSKIKAIADALSTTPAYIMGWDEEFDQAADDTHHYIIDPDAEKMIVDMYENPDLRVVFDCARKVKPQDLEQVAKLIKTFIPEDSDDHIC